MLDVDRGVTKRKHPTGFTVAMYKDNPGVFVDINGEEVGEEMAAKAGFDVDALAHERRKHEKMAEARAQIEAEFASKTEEIERVLDARSDTHKVKHVGGGKYGIFDGQGKRLTRNPMTKEEAEDFVATLGLDEKANETQDETVTEPVSTQEV